MNAKELDNQLESLGQTALKVKRERDRFRTALLKYAHCRHAQTDCFCTLEARAALWEQPKENA